MIRAGDLAPGALFLAYDSRIAIKVSYTQEWHALHGLVAYIENNRGTVAYLSMNDGKIYSMSDDTNVNVIEYDLYMKDELLLSNYNPTVENKND